MKKSKSFIKDFFSFANPVMGRLANEYFNRISETIFERVMFVPSSNLDPVHRKIVRDCLKTDFFNHRFLWSHYRPTIEGGRDKDLVYLLRSHPNQSNSYIPNAIYKGVPFRYHFSSGDRTEAYLVFIRGTLDIESLVKEAYEEFKSEEAVNTTQKRPFNKFSLTHLSCLSKGIAQSSSTRRSEPNHTQSYPVDPTDAPVLGIGNRNVQLSYDINTDKSINVPIVTLTTPEDNPLEGTYYEDNILKEIDNLLDWAKSGDWFKKKRLPWKRGLLLEGPPGTGKSTLPVVIGKTIGIPVTFIHLPDCDNSNFKMFWNSASIIRPCVIVIEEIDTIFNGRKPVNPDCKLSFETILNCISSSEEVDGIITIITTNNPESIDPALGVRSGEDLGGISSRPGRIDTILHLGAMSDKTRLAMVSDILSDTTDLIEDVYAKTKGFTPAQVEFYCGSVALERRKADIRPQ